MGEDFGQHDDAKAWLTQRLPALLDGSNSFAADLKFTLRLPGIGSWSVDLKGAAPRCLPGEIDDANCTIEIAAADLMRIVGQPDCALEIYDAGRIKLTGSVDAALEVVSLFHRVGALEAGGGAWLPPQRPEDFTYNPLAPGFDDDPFPVYAYMRKHAPVYYWSGLKYWLLSKYEDVRAALTDPRMTTDHTIAPDSPAANAGDEGLIGKLLENSPLRLSDEKQARFRSLINPVLSVHAIERMRPDVERLVEELLTPLGERPVVNLVDEFTELLPRKLIALLFKIGNAHRDAFECFTEALMDSLITRPQRMDVKRANHAVREGLAALKDIIAEKRRKPAADVLSAMIASERQGQRLEVDDLLSLIATLLTTGADSSVYALNQALLCLLRFPDQADLLRQQPALLGNLLDEVLRFDNFHKLGIPRWATQDIELRGQLIRKGDAIAAMFQSAGRDDEIFADADVFDVRRDLKAAFTFGRGRHSCPGAAIAQLEFKTAFAFLLRRFPGIELAGKPVFRPQMYVRALKDLPVALRGAKRVTGRPAAPLHEQRAGRSPELRSLGPSALRVSAFTLGTVTFGDSKTFMKNRTASKAEARRIFDVAVDAGINLIDTADVYCEGESEELVGEWARGKRDKLLLATKCRYPMGFGMLGPAGPHDQGLSRQHVVRACEDSLRRLRTDVIDLYQVQAQDTSVPIDETLRALQDLVAQGKVRYAGCATYSGYRLVESIWAAERSGGGGYVSAQVLWSLIDRGAERELVPACRHFGLGMLAWSPLAQGFLSGKYRRGRPPTSGADLAAAAALYRSLDKERNWRVLDVVERIGVAHEAPPAAVALAWLLRRPGLSSVILTARSVEQLQQSLQALAVDLSPQDLATLDQASEPDWGYPYDRIGPAATW